MALSIIITIVFFLLILYRYKEGIVISSMTLQLLSYIGTGIPGVKIFFLISILALCLYPFKKDELSIDPYPKWIKWSSFFFLLSFSITLLFSNYMHWQTVVVNYICYFIFPFIFWKCLDSEYQIGLAMKWLVSVMIVSTIFGFIESVFRNNIIFNLIQNTIIVEDFSFDDTRVRYGLKRANSIFSYFSTYGIACFVSLIIFYSKKYFCQDDNKMLSILILLCAFGAFSTGSRAIFLGLFLACFLLFFQKHFFNSQLGRKVLFGSILLSPVLYSIGYQVMDSMINSETSKYAQGSTSDLREYQWQLCLPYFLESPIWGNGRMYIWDVVSAENSGLLGAESIWFSIFVDYGIIGAIAFVFLVISCCIHLFKLNWRLLCLPIGYLFILTLSPDTGITYNILISFTIMLLRMYQFNHEFQ